MKFFTIKAKRVEKGIHDDDSVTCATFAAFFDFPRARCPMQMSRIRNASLLSREPFLQICQDKTEQTFFFLPFSKHMCVCL